MIVNNLHLYPSELKHPSRILKESESLIQARLVDQVYLGGISRTGLPKTQDMNQHCHIHRLPIKAKGIPVRSLARLLGIGEWSFRVLHCYAKMPAHIVQCHSLTCLHVGVLFKRLYGSKLVYDCHELETETASSKGVRKSISKVVERALIPQADRVIVVGECIRQWYEEHYGRGDVVVVRNVPFRSMQSPAHSDRLKQAFSLAAEDMLFIYQGVFALERKTDLLLRTFAGDTGNKHVVFMGMGALQDMVIQYANKYPNIHYQPAVPPNEIISYTSGADVGLSFFDGSCLNYQFCLPNKFFEYLTAGLPVLASDLPEMGALIDQYGYGWRAPEDERELTDFISSLTWDEIRAKRQKALASHGSFGWEDEAEKLLAVYRDLRQSIGNR